MTLAQKRKLISGIWMACAYACAIVSLIFDNAGKVSFALAVVGVAFLLIGAIQEIVVYKKNKKQEGYKMALAQRRKLISGIWMGCAYACAIVSLIFDNAGKVSFALAVVGVIFLLIGAIQEIVVYKKNKKMELDK
ncbi:hypothetical protein [Enterococcus sp. AZ109]|uniref:hypothetical protein n=1 Tax=Enterococcus sp. AZ109 TaxID=2774634 RepID=UPI003F24C56B